MRLLRFVALNLFLVLGGLIPARGQLTDSATGVGTNGGAENLCLHTQSPNGSSETNCKGAISDPNGLYSGAAVSAALGSYSLLRVGADVAVVREDGASVVQMAAIAQERLIDTFSLGSLPSNSYFFIATSLEAVPGGTSEGTVLLQVEVSSDDSDNECTLQVFGENSCSTQVPVPLGQGSVNLNVYLAGGVAVTCGPPNCGGGSSSFDIGYKTLVEAKSSLSGWWTLTVIQSMVPR
jgi:hypothetical protein